MRSGKISESVLTRSVLRKIKTERKEVVCGAGIGVDCAVLSFDDGEDSVFSTNPVSAPADMVCVYGVNRALNNVAAAGAEPVGILLSAMLPEELEEKELQNMMAQAEEICSRYHVQIAGGHTEVSRSVLTPCMTVSVMGQVLSPIMPGRARPGQDVVLSKWIGLEGTVRLAARQQKELTKRYPLSMIEKAIGFKRYLSIIPEAATAAKSNVGAMHDVSGGGIYAALWELAESAGVGLSVDLKKIPVKQETIEICEFYGLNPYELSSGGCLLMTADNGENLVQDLKAAQIPAAVIGTITEGNDRIVINEEEKRFLERPKTDEICKMM